MAWKTDWKMEKLKLLKFIEESRRMEITNEQIEQIRKALGQPAPAPEPSGQPKAGFKTSEFWLTLVVTLGGLILPLLEASPNPWVRLAGVVAGALVSTSFVQGRATVKAASV